MDSIRVSEALGPRSIRGEATMFYAYVIKSINAAYFYKGHCADLQKRLIQHNSGMTKSIKAYLPFELIYFESFNTLKEAIEREKYFKSSTGRKF